MIKIFIPEKKRRYNKKNLARGFWRNDKGITFYDYVRPINYNQKTDGLYYQEAFYNYLLTIKAGYNQECIFFVKDNKGFIFYDKNKIISLDVQVLIKVSRKELKEQIKSALKTYNGVTVYKEGNNFLLEIYHAINEEV